MFLKTTPQVAVKSETLSLKGRWALEGFVEAQRLRMRNENR
jgi:hypothetical protein